MIDFSSLQSLEIPEGGVAQIEDASGTVLWSAAQPVTITVVDGYITSGNPNGYVTHNGTNYADTTFTANTGDTVTIFMSNSAAEESCVYLNGTYVYSAYKRVTYTYTIVSDATISFKPWRDDASGYYVYDVYITDANA